MFNLKKKTTSRQLKVSELLKRNLAEILVSHFFRVDDECFFTITISEVNISSDLKTAYIFFIPFWQKKQSNVLNQDVIKIIQKDLNSIKKRLSIVLSLRFMPKLIFKIDNTAEEVRKIENLLKSPKVAQDL